MNSFQVTKAELIWLVMSAATWLLGGSALVAQTNSIGVECVVPSTVECGSPLAFYAIVYDRGAELATLVCSVNGIPVETNVVAGGVLLPPTNFVLFNLAPGTNFIELEATANNGSDTGSWSGTVTVIPPPPSLTDLAAFPFVLWPPDHRMAEVRVSAKAPDTCGPVTWRIVNVLSSERTENAFPDWVITGTDTVQLRAEHLPGGEGRIYTILVQATDAFGNVGLPQEVWVRVPKDMGWNRGPH